MNKEELQRNYPPLKVGSQQEFDTFMRRLNDQQANDNLPINNEKAELNRKRQMIKLQIQALFQQDTALRMEYLAIEGRQKDLNRCYHNIKHEMIVLNPKNSAQAVV